MAYRAKRQAKRTQTASGRSWSSNKRLIWAGVLGLVLVIAVSGIFVSGLLGGSRKGDVTAGSPTAALAPDIALTTVDGDFLLSEQRGRVTLLYFSFPG